jgi:phenylacetate-coenzyme A ligase PaaK-like adenylate-forming protein
MVESLPGVRKILARYETWLKATRFSSDIARYNPLYAPSVRRAIQQFDRLDFAARLAKTEQCSRRVLRQARQTRYGAERAVDWGSWPILEKQAIRDNPADFSRRRLISIPAATGGTTGTPLRLARSLRGIVAEQAFIDSLLGDGRSFRTARVAVLRAYAVKDRADDRPPFGRITQGGRCLVMSSYHLSGKTVGW